MISPRILAGIIAVLAASSASCGKSAPQGPPPETTATSTETAPQGWEDGPAALERALSTRARPILLFVTSEWCPPCKAMEANLLSKPAFFEATQGFARIRIDGDSDGAQAISERFDALAYPTLLLLSPEGDELFRADHAIGSEQLSPALAAAKTTLGSFKHAIERLDKGSITDSDCALLAAVDWGPSSGMTLSTERRIDALTRLHTKCGGSPAPVRAQLAAHLLGLASMADMAADSALPGAPVKPLAPALLDLLLQDENTAWAGRTLLSTWAKPVVSFVVGDDRGPRFFELRDRWLAAARSIRRRPSAPVDAVLLGYNVIIDFHKLEKGTAPLEPAVSAEISAAVEEVLSRPLSLPERKAIVPHAAYLLRATGQAPRARALLLEEIAKGSAASYHDTTLSQWALADGDRTEARRLARDAVLHARGRTSRLQWMLNELSLYSDDPAVVPTLIERSAEAYALLFERDDPFLGRNRARAARLREILAPIKGQAGVQSLVRTYSPRCDKLPEGSRAACNEHFALLREAL